METIVLRSSAILKNSPSRGVFLLFHQTAKIVRLTMRRTPTAAAPAITGVFIPPDCLSASVSGPVPSQKKSSTLNVKGISMSSNYDLTLFSLSALKFLNKHLLNTRGFDD